MHLNFVAERILRHVPTLRRVLTAALFILALAAPAGAAQKKLNVLFIAVDDMNNDWGCFEESAREPLIISVPGLTAGMRRKAETLRR